MICEMQEGIKWWGKWAPFNHEIYFRGCMKIDLVNYGKLIRKMRGLELSQKASFYNYSIAICCLD